MESSTRWLTVEQIADHLQVSKETIYRWLDKKLVPAHKIGRQWRFQSREVDSWVRSGGAAENHRTERSPAANPAYTDKDLQQ